MINYYICIWAGNLWWKLSKEGEIDDYAKLPLLGKISVKIFMRGLQKITGIADPELLIKNLANM